MPKEFTYNGFTVPDLQKMSMDEFILLVPSRVRRSLTRGLTPDQRLLLERIRESKRTAKAGSAAIKTHCRDMIILPEMIGLTLSIYSGKEFVPITIQPPMIGHYLGEFVITNKKVSHGTPGIGASRSSMYVPLK
jgi:small subunit ribosomal protein S19